MTYLTKQKMQIKQLTDQSSQLNTTVILSKCIAQWPTTQACCTLQLLTHIRSLNNKTNTISQFTIPPPPPPLSRFNHFLPQSQKNISKHHYTLTLKITLST